MTITIVDTPLRTEESAFLDFLARKPGDATTRLVYADWLDEHARLPEAYAQRWMAAWGKYPHRRDAPVQRTRQVKKWAWYSQLKATGLLADAIERSNALPNRLPVGIYLALDINAAFRNLLLYSSPGEAEEALIRAITILYYELGLKPRGFQQ